MTMSWSFSYNSLVKFHDKNIWKPHDNFMVPYNVYASDNVSSLNWFWDQKLDDIDQFKWKFEYKSWMKMWNANPKWKSDYKS